MKKILLLLVALLVMNCVSAETYTLTPVKKISTSTKSFRLGNVYQFKNIKTNEIINGTVVYYRPNGFIAEEAQIEIANFRDKNNCLIPGKISIVPNNHKKVKEFMNYMTLSGFEMIRGSEIILKPGIHTFEINNTKTISKYEFVQIIPDQEISTIYDEIEVGDYIKFKTMSDSYNIKKNTAVYGIVDYINENGWVGDNAVICFKKFITHNDSGKKLEINSDLQISGLDILKYKDNRFKQFFNYIGVIFRGKEIDIREDDSNISFNLVIENDKVIKK